MSTPIKTALRRIGRMGDNGQLAVRWLQELQDRGLSAATVTARYCAVLRFLRHARGRSVGSLGRADLEAFRAVLVAAGHLPAGIHLYLTGVRAFYHWLEESGLLFENPTAGLLLPRCERRLGHVLSDAEIDRLLAIPDLAIPVGQRDRALLEVAYSTAVRVAELAGMTLGALDLDNGAIRVLGKGNRERLVPLGREAVGRLRSYLTESRPRLLRGREIDALWISGARPEALKADAIMQFMSKLGRRAGLHAPLSCHVFRRTCATAMLRNGAGPEVLRQLLGHRSYRCLTQYLRLSIAEVRAMHRRSKPGR